MPAEHALRRDAGDARRGAGHARGKQVARAGRLRAYAVRLKRALTRDRAGLVAAGVAFYVVLSIFPALAAAVSVYGLVSDPADIQRQVSGLTMLPLETREMLRTQLERLNAASPNTLGLALAGGLLLALWSSTKGVKSLMQAFNIAHHVREERSWFRRIGIALAFTAGAIVLGLVAVFAIGAVPQLVQAFRLGGAGGVWVQIGTWVVVAGFTAGYLALAYRYLPSPNADRRTVKPGVLVAIPVWLAGSVLFSLYVSRFGSYEKTYGTLGTAVILMMWLWVSAFIAILGAEVNRVVEEEERGEPLGPEDPATA